MRIDAGTQAVIALSRLGFLGDGLALGAQSVLLQKIEKRSQLQPWDVGPAAAELHVLKEAEQSAALRRKAGSKRPILDGTMEMFQLA
jgi:hypothetical protein